MDQKWFTAVREKLEQIEHENSQRFGKLNPRSLVSHPLIMSSSFWHASDAQATADDFDWNSSRYPHAYVKALNRESFSAVKSLAVRPYDLIQRDQIETQRIENQKTLVSRILFLQLNHLLPVKK